MWTKIYLIYYSGVILEIIIFFLLLNQALEHWWTLRSTQKHSWVCCYYTMGFMSSHGNILMSAHERSWVLMSTHECIWLNGTMSMIAHCWLCLLMSAQKQLIIEYVGLLALIRSHKCQNQAYVLMSMVPWCQMNSWSLISTHKHTWSLLGMASTEIMSSHVAMVPYSWVLI